jgi:hypothetical protein
MQTMTSITVSGMRSSSRDDWRIIWCQRTCTFST